MPLPERERQELFTYKDYCSWDDGRRYELYEGEVRLMAGPSRAHQGINAALTAIFVTYLRGKPCRVYPAPFDVRLNASDEDNIVVQPDLTIVCDRSKLNDAGCAGAPDMVIEIISPSSARYDRIKKFELYRRYGVGEYWIVDPDSRILEVYILRDGYYTRTGGYSDGDTVESATLPGLTVNMEYIFQEDTENPS
ncbi:MAG: Uma2 family endonuclease [Clostridiales bacterium]|jgi:Uma2 family endonuclease|nr:Uma2 family endonuclease [Clostridiales bacterium]